MSGTVRRLAGVVLWLLAVFTVPVSAAASGTVLVVGDSLSAGYGVPSGRGWVALLEQRLDALACPFEVVNASVSGDTTTGGAARLPAALERHAPAVVVLELGGNDGLRGQPLSLIESNLERMLLAARGAGSRVLLLGMRIPPNYGPVYAEGFEGIFRNLHERFEVPYVPFFLESVALDPALMQDDGIHPTAAAQPMMLDAVWPTLRPLLEAAAPCR